MIFLQMQIDALLLLIMTACCIVVAQEDAKISRLQRWAVLFVGAMAFAQSMWLMGIWTPGSAGYPWPRLTLDIGLAAASVIRAVAVLKAARLAKYKCHQHAGMHLVRSGDRPPARTRS